jgi:ABC-type Fe3+/spermidine/putrescine transport system ATPase subunit
MTGTGVPAIELTDLHRVFGRTTAAVDGITLRVERGEILTLLGPSGCGKSTTLRCIAGLERPDDGDIQIGGRMVSSFGAGRVIGLPRVWMRCCSSCNCTGRHRSSPIR